VREVPAENRRCFFLRRVVARLDLSAFTIAYDEEGRRLYHPALNFPAPTSLEPKEIPSRPTVKLSEET